MEVNGARYTGYEISVTIMGAAFAAKVRPKPMRNLNTIISYDIERICI